jgi:uncharacterized protein YbjT (DUF2867 family)
VSRAGGIRIVHGGEDVKAPILVTGGTGTLGQHLVPRLASGIGRTTFGYFGSKLGAERAVAGSGLPWTKV